MRRLFVAFALLAGCHKSEDAGPSCAQVVDHMLEVTKQQLIGHEGMTLGPRQAMIQQCEQRKMPAATRKCLVEAKSLGDIASCRAGKRRGEGSLRTPGAPPVRPPAGSAGPAPTAAPR